MKKLKVYLDFDGTVVEHAYPKIGRENFGCDKTILALIKAGHDVVINTMRVEFPGKDSEEMKAAIRFVDYRFHFEEHFGFCYTWVHTEKKHPPHPWILEMMIENGELFIDDQQTGVPLKPAVMNQSMMVDFDKVYAQLLEAGVI